VGGEKQGTETSYMRKSWDAAGREPVLGALLLLICD